MSYKTRVTFFVMMVLAFLLLTLNSIHVHAAEVAADGSTHLQAAPPVVHMTMADVTGAIVVSERMVPKVVILVFRIGKVFPMDIRKCYADVACSAKLTELLDAKTVLIVNVGKAGPPDTQT